MFRVAESYRCEVVQFVLILPNLLNEWQDIIVWTSLLVQRMQPKVPLTSSVR